MKKRFVLVALLFSATLYAAAQASGSLNEYVGKYTFPEGSFVTSAEIKLLDSVLSVSSSQGGSPLQKRGKDTFALTAFDGGMMYFFRNSSGQVARVKVEVDDVLLEGTKDGVPMAWRQRDRYLASRKTAQAR